jgi:glycosyltransferase involved in cell wall biosynthesis
MQTINSTPDERTPVNGHLKLKTDTRPLISVITPAYNESAIIIKNLNRLHRYLHALEDSYRYEIIVVNDGSKDDTGILADQFAKEHPHVIVHHHRVNKNLGGALQTGFRLAQGEYVVVMDLDLSYSEDHIARLLTKMVETDADMVIASPYMKGGKNTDVPFLRLLLSKVVNRIMRFTSPTKIHTFTSMVRVYKSSFLRKLNLKSVTYSINPEIIHKGLILRANIQEIPAHLDWSFQKEIGKKRTSGIRIFSGITAGLMSSFIFRPYSFFMTVGLTLLIAAVYIIIWIFIHTFELLPDVPAAVISWEDRFSVAVGQAFAQRPYAFLIGGVCLLAALQFLGIGFLSLQSKRYFDELFHIHTTLLERLNTPDTLKADYHAANHPQL